MCVLPHYFEAYDMKVSFMPLFYELDRYDQELSIEAFCISLSKLPVLYKLVYRATQSYICQVL